MNHTYAINIDLNEAPSYLILLIQAKCELGTKAYSEMASLGGLDRKQVSIIMKRFLSKSCGYLLQNLPLNIQVLLFVMYLNLNQSVAI